MPRQRMENLEHLGGLTLDHLRSRLKQDPDGVLAKEEEVSEEFDPETLPVFLTRGARVVGFVGQPKDGVKASSLLSFFLEKALLNDVGMVRVEERREEQKVHKQPLLEFDCANCGDWHEGDADFLITTPSGRTIPFCTEECKRAWEQDEMGMAPEEEEPPLEWIAPPQMPPPYFVNITTTAATDTITVPTTLAEWEQYLPREPPPMMAQRPQREPDWVGILRNMGRRG